MTGTWLEPVEAMAAWDEDDWLYTCLAFDPGGTTGWGLMGVHPDAMNGDPELTPFGPPSNLIFWTAGEFAGSQDSQVERILDLIAAWPYARLVTEDFKLKQLNAELDPVEINAILRHLARPRYFVKQMPALAMGALPDDRQKQMGLWVPGKQHARDALKHCYTFIKRQKQYALKAGRIVQGP